VNCVEITGYRRRQPIAANEIFSISLNVDVNSASFDPLALLTSFPGVTTSMTLNDVKLPKHGFLRDFLRATAVPAGTAEARISYGDSVRPSVCHGPVQKQPSDIETPGLHHVLA